MMLDDAFNMRALIAENKRLKADLDCIEAAHDHLFKTCDMCVSHIKAGNCDFYTKHLVDLLDKALKESNNILNGIPNEVKENGSG